MRVFWFLVVVVVVNGMVNLVSDVVVYVDIVSVSMNAGVGLLLMVLLLLLCKASVVAVVAVAAVTVAVTMVAIKCISCISHSFIDFGVGWVVNGHKGLLILISRVVIRVFIALVRELVSTKVIVGVVGVVSIVIGVHGMEVISVTVSGLEIVVTVCVSCHGMDMIF